MAVITKIRNYSGLLIAVIGFALAAFVLGDFLGYGPVGRGGFDVGKVEKTAIPFQEFERRVGEQLDSWRNETGNQNINQRDAFQIRQQVWNQMVREILMDDEMDRLGIQVPSNELLDLISGPEPHQLILRSFTDPATGSFDPEQVRSFLQNFDQIDPTVQNQWINLERFIKRDRAEQKYFTLISKGFYVPELFAGKDYSDRNTSADFSFVMKRFDQIADTLVQVSDRDLRRIYDERKEQFRQEASVHIDYVSFNVFATDEDREDIRRELMELRDELASAEVIEPFINSVSDRRFDARFFGTGELSPEIDPLMFEAEPGFIHGPYIEDNAWILAKLVDTQMRPDSMRASHILIAYQGSAASNPNVLRNRDQAMELADSLYQIVRTNPRRFSELATAFSDDPSAAVNAGDLEWFSDGAMVPEFNEAVVNGPLNSFTTVETNFGVHVIHITGKSPLSKKIQVAKLARDIEPSGRTYQRVYGQASEFANALRRNKNFTEVATQKELNIREVPGVRAMDFSLPGIESPRPIIQWAFADETKTGDISRIFEIDNRFIVATLRQRTDEGIPALDRVRDQVRALAIQEKKFEMIAADMRQAGQKPDAIAQAMQLELRQAQDVRFTTQNLAGVGVEPRVIAKAFTLDEGQVSDPIRGQNGVFVVEISRKVPVTLPDDLGSARQQLLSAFRNRVQTESYNALRNAARIEDNRSMFF